MKRALKLRRRLFAASGFLLAALSACVTLLYRSENQTAGLQAWVLHTQEVLGEIAEAEIDYARIYGSCSAPAVARNGHNELRSNDGVMDFNRAITHLRQLTVDNPRQQRILDEFGDLKRDCRSIGAESIAYALDRGSRQNSATMPPAKTTLTLLGTLEDNERGLLARRTDRVRHSVANGHIVLLLTLSLAVLLTLLSAYLFQRELLTRAKIEAGLREAQELLGVRYQEQRAELDHALSDLHQQIRERQQAEFEVRRLNEQLENRVRARTTELQEINRELEAFIYSVSHDLRAPLRHMDGFSRILQQTLSSQISKESQHAVNRIREAAVHMTDLVEDLLRLSKIGRELPQPVAISLNELVKTAQQEAMADASGRSIDWKIESLPKVEADPTLLRHVLTNLLSNAVKFTRERSPAKIQVGSYRDKGELVIFIKDNGAGFDRNYADKLFGVFQRLHRQDQFEGTGIGLAIAQRIVHKHRGRIWADAKPDQGATFFFSLPEHAENTAEPGELVGALA